MRIAMGIEYDGTNFHGWQTQAGSAARTVQFILETAISKVANHAVTVHCAGRTDAGVHAIGQVIHFNTTATRTLRSWLLGSNTNLPSDINLNWVHNVANDFHARFSATSRNYRYTILNRPARSALERSRAWWIYYPLNETNMQAAAIDLIGTHDFSAYRGAGCQAQSPLRTINYLKIYRQHEFIYIDIGANGFLYQMVRNIVGVLTTIGRGDKPVNWAKEVLCLKNRTLAGVTAPPQGLCLIKIDYPYHFGLPTT